MSLGSIHAAAFALALSAAPLAAATVVVDTGEPTDPIAAVALSREQTLFGQFVSNVGRITSARIYAFANGDCGEPVCPLPLTISLFADAGGLPDIASPLASADIVVLATSAFEIEFLGSDALDFVVTPGETYWIGFSTPTIASFGLPTPPPNPLSSYAFVRIDQELTNVGASPWGVRIEGMAVPEPGSWALMIAGFGVIGLTARRRRPANPRLA